MNENAFLLNASRINLSDNNIIRLKELSGKQLNWSILTRKISNHGVANLIYYSLNTHNLSDIIPEKTYEYLKNEYYKTAYYNSVLIEEIKKLSKIIDKKIILLKGADLIQNLYPIPAIRPMCDVDILIEKNDADAVWKELLNHGFKSKSKTFINKSKVHDTNTNRLPVHLFGLYTDKYLLEIHWNLFIKEELYSLTKIAWDTACRFKDNLYLLSDEIMLIHLCFHFIRHAKEFAVLRMLCDINELIVKKGKSIDWKMIKLLCADNELEGKVKLALTYTSALFDTPVPEEFIYEKLLKKEKISPDTLTIGETNEDVLKRFNKKLKRIYRPGELLVFIFRTFFPVKGWIMDTYKISSTEKIWKGYLKYWKYLFMKYLLFRRAQLGN